MRRWIQAALVGSAVGVLAVIATPARAQRTGDHLVPSFETVCDGDPYSFGLCNAYCEALDCESATPLGTPRACSNLLRNYQKKSGGALPPCSCPCQFDVRGDFEFLIEAAAADPGAEITGIDLDATYQQFCDEPPPLGTKTLVAEAFQVLENPEDDPQGVRLVYWLTAAAGDDPATCNEEGGGLDGTLDDLLDWHYGPYIELSGDAGIPLTPSEYDTCLQALTFLCSQGD
jgi:hypothetical protein